MRQFFAKNLNDNNFEFSDEDNHHILNVLRLKNNDEFIVVYKDKKYTSSININKNVLTAKKIKEVEENNELNCNVTLIYSLPKSDKFEFVIQKATELGVNNIVPFLSKYSLFKFDNDKEKSKLDRWKKIIYSAAKQANRVKIPNITNIKKISELDEFKSDLNLVAYENEKDKGTSELFSLLSKDYRSISIIVGPEGGFSKEEIEYLKENNFITVSLGKRILRSETAPVYIMSVISFMNERGE